MDSAAERLRFARKKSGFRSARAAALHFGWPEATYRSHERGPPEGRNYDLNAAKRYGRAFKRDPLWLLHNIGEGERKTVPIVGLAGAGPGGSILYSSTDGGLGEAEMPSNATDSTVAVEVRGDSMRGVADNGWLVYYDARHEPPGESLIGRLCVVGLSDGRVLIKKLRRSKKGGQHFDLESTPPTAVIRDAKVDWAAAVVWIKIQ